MPKTWFDGPLTLFDCESTGTNVEEDLILSAAVIKIPPGQPGTRRTPQISYWLLNHQVPIPKGAYDVHGLHEDFLAAWGEPPAPPIEAITTELALNMAVGTPTIIMNAPYDLTILDRNCRRLGIEPLSDRLPDDIQPVVDPLVLDKHLVVKRAGKRRLEDLCRVYGVKYEDAHHSAEDALMTGRVVHRICDKYPAIARSNPAVLHANQIGWRRDQQEDLADYFRSIGKKADVDISWPIRPWKEPT